MCICDSVKDVKYIYIYVVIVNLMVNFVKIIDN